MGRIVHMFQFPVDALETLKLKIKVAVFSASAVCALPGVGVCVPWVSAVGVHSLGARVVGRAFQSKRWRLMPPLGCGLAGVTRLYR